MRNILFACTLLSLLLAMACEKQNEPTTEVIQRPRVLTADYLASLRAYKNSDHQLAFGWFGNSGGDGKSAAMNVRWESIPDSMDIVSLWGGTPVEGSPQMAAMRYAQEKKGTRVVMVTFSNDPFITGYGGDDFISQYVEPGGDSLLTAGFEKIAKAVADTVNKYKLDGVDLDHEPHVCGCSNWTVTYTPHGLGLLLKALSKYFGPASGTGKLLIVDGEVDQTSEGGPYLDYAVAQAYNSTSPSGLDSRYSSIAGWLAPGKFIVTENFEDYWKTGGTSYSDPVHGVIPSLLGMAYWNPAAGRKGGCGSYHAEYEYANPVPYQYMRQAIQIMNPPVQ